MGINVTTENIKKSGNKIYFVITGGGSLAISDMLTQGGASSFFLGAEIPYSCQSTLNLLGVEKLDSFCSDETARKLAAAAFDKAKKSLDGVSCNPSVEGAELVYPDLSNVFGVSCAASLAKEGEREGRKNRAYIGIHTIKGTVTQSITFTKTIKNTPWSEARINQEAILADCIVFAVNRIVANFYTLDFKEYDSPTHVEFSGQAVEITTKYAFSSPEEQCLYTMNSPHCVVYKDDAVKRDLDDVVFSGSFNPPHEGHLGVVEAFIARYPDRGVWLEFPIRSFGKAGLDIISIHERVENCKRLFGDKIKGVIASNATYFHQKTLLYSTLASGFIVGVDTVNRVFDPATNIVPFNDMISMWRDMKFKFFVFNRGDELVNENIVNKHGNIVEIMPKKVYSDAGHSSTKIRKESVSDHATAIP